MSTWLPQPLQTNRLYLRGQTDEDEVIAVTQTANTRSCRLLDKLGATFQKSFKYKNTPVKKYGFSRTAFLHRDYG